MVGYVLSAVAQNSTPQLDNPATQVAPNLEPPWPVKPPWPERPAAQVAPNPKPPEPDNPAAQVAPNPESLSSEELDNSAMQVLKSLAPKLKNPTTQAIPYPSATIRPKTRKRTSSYSAEPSQDLYAFRFLRQPSRPNPARPDAKSGRAPGTGTLGTGTLGLKSIE